MGSHCRTTTPASEAPTHTMGHNGGLAVDGLSGRGLHDAVERGGVDAEGAGDLADGLTFVK